MSVSQVKKRFSEMETYLRNDKEGLRRLKLLKDDVNVLRVSLASAIEAKETADVVKDAARERADAAESELGVMSIEADSLRQQVASLAKQLIDKPSDNDEAKIITHVNDSKSSEIRAVIKSLKKELKQCPKHIKRSNKLQKPARFYNRHDIAPGWTHRDLWTLGASVAVLSQLSGQVVIVSDKILDKMKNESGDNTGLSIDASLWRDPTIKAAKVWGEETVGSYQHASHVCIDPRADFSAIVGLQANITGK